MTDATVIWVVKFPREGYKMVLIFYMPKINVNLGKHFLVTSYFQKRFPIFDGSPLYLKVTSFEQQSLAEFIGD